jgi:hypothetical protein
MDKLLKLKLEMVYKDFPLEQARQHYDEIKSKTVEKPVKVKRKLRIPAK